MAARVEFPNGLEGVVRYPEIGVFTGLACQPPGADGHRDNVAVMAVTADNAVPQAVVDEIVASDGFVEGRAVSL